jgi:hypothetical protein
MSLKACRECNREVSASASKCPHCGASYPGGRGRAFGRMFLIGLPLGILALFCLAWLANEAGWLD